MLNIAHGRGCFPSARLITEMLQAKGIRTADVTGFTRDPAAPTLYYGAPAIASFTGPALNKRPARTKLAELNALFMGSVPTPEVREILTDSDFQAHPIWYARKDTHRGGTDIRLVTSPQEAEWRRAAGWAYFTSMIPVAKEFRIWAFRDRHLGTYEKVMERPEEYQKYGRNHGQGFAFRRLKGGVEGGLELASQALTALGLDFGAADVVQDRTGKLYVLEVNTAPGIESPSRTCAQRLVSSIERWYNGL